MAFARSLAAANNACSAMLSEGLHCNCAGEAIAAHCDAIQRDYSIY
jgi:hypothetical protein